MAPTTVSLPDAAAALLGDEVLVCVARFALELGRPYGVAGAG
jgi:hypothetical protein